LELCGGREREKGGNREILVFLCFAALIFGLLSIDRMAACGFLLFEML
jgi:nitrate reductase NapE component